jgi:hypothetical protein
MMLIAMSDSVLQREVHFLKSFGFLLRCYCSFQELSVVVFDGDDALHNGGSTRFDIYGGVETGRWFSWNGRYLVVFCRGD